MDFIKGALKSHPLRKMQYFQCLKGGNHEGEKLNYVCLNKDEKVSGLMCSICKADNSSYDKDIVPLKMLLDRLRDSKMKDFNEKGMQSDSMLESMLESLENTKTMIMFELKTGVEKLSSMFMKLEEKLLKDFEEMKSKILEEVNFY